MRRCFPLLLLVAGCQAEPKGQVVARVDGVEITDREVATEAEAMGADPRRAADRKHLVDTLIDRKLLAQGSTKDLIDRTPAVQIAIRRAREEVLARAFLNRIAARTPPPTDAQLDAFMRANPHRFTERTGFLVIRTTSAGRSGEHILLDSDTMSPDAVTRLVRDGTMIYGAGRQQTIDRLANSWKIVDAADGQRTRARAVLVRAQVDAAIARQLAALRAGAVIERRPDSQNRP